MGNSGSLRNSILKKSANAMNAVPTRVSPVVSQSRPVRACSTPTNPQIASPLTAITHGFSAARRSGASTHGSLTAWTHSRVNSATAASTRVASRWPSTRGHSRPGAPATVPLAMSALPSTVALSSVASASGRPAPSLRPGSAAASSSTRVADAWRGAADMYTTRKSSPAGRGREWGAES